jgi:hypothetical protein
MLGWGHRIASVSPRTKSDLQENLDVALELSIGHSQCSGDRHIGTCIEVDGKVSVGLSVLLCQELVKWSHPFHIVQICTHKTRLSLPVFVFRLFMHE